MQGQGLVFAPLPLVLPLLRANALRPVLTDHVAQPARLFIHYASRKHVPARVKIFVDFLLRHLRANPDLVSDPQKLLAPFAGPQAIVARTPDDRANKAAARRR